MHDPDITLGIASLSRANQAAARFRMSRSIRSRLFCRCRRSSSIRASVVSPSLRRPSAKSACLTQLRIVCSEGSNSRASDPGLRPAVTNSTICSSYSGGYRPLLPALAHLLRSPKWKGVRLSGTTPAVCRAVSCPRTERHQSPQQSSADSSSRLLSWWRNITQRYSYLDRLATSRSTSRGVWRIRMPSLVSPSGPLLLLYVVPCHKLSSPP